MIRFLRWFSLRDFEKLFEEGNLQELDSMLFDVQEELKRIRKKKEELNSINNGDPQEEDPQEEGLALREWMLDRNIELFAVFKEFTHIGLALREWYLLSCMILNIVLHSIYYRSNQIFFSRINILISRIRLREWFA
jgi:hypothetical protein